MTKYYEFDCGCKFPINEDPNIKQAKDGFPSIDIDFDKIPLTCQKTWELLCLGRVTGCFQLESNLGKTWDKKMKPVCVEDVSALLALIRPSCINAYVDGKSMAERFIERRNGNEEYHNFHNEADEILDDTFGTILYQEQAILIARKFAGLSLKDADNLRKAMGKKDAELMQEVRLQFIDGCDKCGIITKEEAEAVFDIIEKSSRYSFNKCLSLDTNVYLESGYPTEIKNLKIGDRIYAPTVENNFHRNRRRYIENKYVDVINIYKNGEQDLYETQIGSGRIRCTMNHKFLTSEFKSEPLWYILSTGQSIYTIGKSLEKPKVNCYIGKQETIDIEVNDDLHCFYANGIATSNSHSVSYGLITYRTAYVKAHFPLDFYTAWLSECEGANSEDSISELVSDSKTIKTKINPPSILKSSENFSIEDLTIRFGLGNIRSVGESGLASIRSAIEEAEKELSKKLKDFTWSECVFYILIKINKSISMNLLASGCFSHLMMSRQIQMFEFLKIKSLTKAELKYIYDNKPDSIVNAIKSLINVAKQSRKEKLESLLKSIENPPNNLSDNEEWIANVEKHTLGYAITCSKLDSRDISASNVTCKNFNDADELKNAIISCQIDRLSEYRPKAGKMAGLVMAYLTVSDSTGPCECVAYPDKYNEYAALLFSGNTVMLYGNKNSKTGSLTINRVEQL